jgi:hypothetical protein
MAKIINKDVTKMNAAELSAYMVEIQAQLATAQAAVKSKKDEQVAELNDKIDTFPAMVGKILGKEVGKEDFANMVKAWAKGTLSFNSESSEGSSRLANRLTDEQKVELRARRLAREVAKIKGTPAEQMSVIAAAFGCTYQTAANETYAPNQKQIEDAIAASA